ncbi:MAG: PilZ domain-containing protein [Acidobacteria bacterium]|nr:PilZ domain-containing protein [Acidobacteriota bacterium]
MYDDQRRRSPRYEVHDLHGSLLFRLEVNVLNLSLAGAAVETTRQLKPGKAYTIRIGGGDGGMDLDGTVKWCHLTKTRRGENGELVTIYNAGLAFDGTLTEKSHRLLAFMQDHVVLALEKRIVGRFRVRAGASIAVTTRYDFEVLKLSMTGMLVRTALLAEVEPAFEMELKLGDELLEVAGRIAYAEKVGGSDDFPDVHLGVEFLELDERRRQMLKDFISHELA